MKNSDDSIFWERLQGMPFVEQELECVRRREELCAINVNLNEKRQELYKESREAKELGREVSANNALLTRLGERIKHLRKVQDSASWRCAVTALFGQEGYEACRIWIEETGIYDGKALLTT